MWAPAATADSVEVWNGFDAEVVNAQRFMLRVRGEIRSSNAFRDFLSARGIVEARVPVARHFHAIGQYQAVEARPERFGWEGYNRATGGIELPFEREKITLTVRSAGEHFWFKGEKDYQRHRERVQVRFKQLRFQPLVGLEIMGDAQGWSTTRATGSVIVPIKGRLSLDTGYHYELRPPRAGGNRHVIYTFFRLKKPQG